MGSEPARALADRIRALERHGVALEEAFRSEALRAEVRGVMAALREADASLRAVGGAAVVARIETELDAIAARLAGIGRAR